MCWDFGKLGKFEKITVSKNLLRVIVFQFSNYVVDWVALDWIIVLKISIFPSLI